MKTKVDWTPLLEAARLGSEYVFLRLLERGVDLLASTPKYKKQAVGFAFENGHVQVLKHIMARRQEVMYLSPGYVPTIK